ncbi:glycogen debranching N-terminal domain-containing protein [Paeniglutamicibacter sp.]|uniref:glycogen debranching N-terminal domain-containing protein n=1 Tax=Paeniglutamicibacter sp. TaxID=1934391 RepID=UPI00398A4737
MMQGPHHTNVFGPGAGAARRLHAVTPSRRHDVASGAPPKTRARGRSPRVRAWTSGVGGHLAGPGALTILHGTTFALAPANSGMGGIRPHEFFFRETGFISGWRLRINGREVEPLCGTALQPFKAMFVGRVAGSRETESHALIERHRSLNGGLKERIVVHTYSNSEFTATLVLGSKSISPTYLTSIPDAAGGLAPGDPGGLHGPQPHGCTYPARLWRNLRTRPLGGSFPAPCGHRPRGRHLPGHPPRLDAARIPVGTGTGGYACFLGRMHPNKGVLTAIHVARRAGVPLRIAAKMASAGEHEYFANVIRPELGGDIV